MYGNASGCTSTSRNFKRSGKSQFQCHQPGSSVPGLLACEWPEEEGETQHPVGKQEDDEKPETLNTSADIAQRDGPKNEAGLNGALAKEEYPKEVKKQRKNEEATSNVGTSETQDNEGPEIIDLTDDDEEAVKECRMLLSGSTSFFRDLIPRLVSCLAEDVLPKLQLDAMELLAEMASEGQSQAMIDACVIPELNRLLSFRDDIITERALLCLGKIAEQPSFRRLVLSNENEATVRMLQCLAGTSATLFAGNHQISYTSLHNSLPVLARLLEHSDEEILEATCRALSGLCCETNVEANRLVLGLGICGRLVDLIHLPNQKVLYWALVVVKNLYRQGDTHVKTFLLKIMHAKEMTSSIRVLLSNTDCRIRKVAYEIVAAIAAGNTNHIQFLIDTMIIPIVLKSINAKTQVEEVALRAIYGVSRAGNPRQISYLATHNCVVVLRGLLESTADSFVVVALKTTRNIAKNGGKYAFVPVEKGNMITKLDNLCRHPNPAIRQQAKRTVQILASL